VAYNPFETGLNALREFDEPTLILFPDAVKLTAPDLGELQKQTLLQCDDLGDRFGVFDLTEKGNRLIDWQTGRDEFRNGIGVNNLKYGAAYTPWLKVQFDKTISLKNLTLKKNEAVIEVKDLPIPADVAMKLAAALGAKEDQEKISEGVKALAGAKSSAREQYDDLLIALQAPDKARYQALLNFLVEIAAKFRDWLGPDPAGKLGSPPDKGIGREVTNLVVANLAPLLKKLIGYYNGAAEDPPKILVAADIPKAEFEKFKAVAPWTISAAEIDNPKDLSIYKGQDRAVLAVVPDAIKAALPSVRAIAEIFLTAVEGMNLTAAEVVKKAESEMADSFPIYKRIISNAARRPTLMPPSGAIAGVYAYVDRTRGVWKSPANVSLAGVYGVSTGITREMQDGLNVDAGSGKSINAIRFFTGKGYLVWGARTLAGNDNEWRYVGVRRLFNMAEESIQKATAWVVFDPNDAGTWVRVQGMIENFLTVLWRQGALAGAKPEQAFYVNVGLGKTMTPLDILEGRLIIDVGMAAVRPAEFIVLRFMHKLQQA
jgi:hypothetical protein